MNILKFQRVIFLCSYIFFSNTLFSFVPLKSLDEVALWQDSELPLTFDYNLENCPLDKENMRSQIEKGLKLWNIIPGSRIKLQIGDETTKKYEDFSKNFSFVERPIIQCRLDFVEKFAEENTEALIVGYGGFLATGVTGGRSYIKKGYIMLNIDPTSKAGDYIKNNPDFLFFTVAHEAGHVIGLGHSRDKDSIMNYAQSVDDGLGFDDYFGARYLYPSKAGIDDLTECASLAVPMTRKNSLPLYLFFLSPLFFLLLF